MAGQIEHRAAPPRAPEPTRALQRELAENEDRRKQAEVEERRGMARGLLILAGVVLLASFWRAGWERVFLHGWWRHW